MATTAHFPVIEQAAAAPRPSLLLRFFPSLTDVCFLLPIVFVLLNPSGLGSLLGDGDTGWHVRTGEWIMAHGKVPSTDIFSFTKAGEPWFAWEWLWDLVFGWMHQRAGMAAVVFASLLLLSLTFALLFRLVLRKCGNVWIAFAVTFAAIAGSTLHWLARPHLFTLFFPVVFLFVLDRVDEGRRRLLWLLPVLTVLWTNLHGGFLVGITLPAMYGLGEFAAALFAPGRDRRSESIRRGIWYLVAAFGCALASLVNPYTWRLHVHIFQYLTDPYHFQQISEFQSMSFHNPMMRFFEVMIVLGIVSAVWHIRQGRFAYPTLIAAWLHAALYSARNIPIYLIVAAPAIAWALEELLRKAPVADIAPWFRRTACWLDEFAAEFGALDRVGRVYLTSALAVVLVASVAFSPMAPPRFRSEYDPKTYPAKAVEMLRATGPGRLFTDDEWGDYVIYRLYPDIKVFIDGRSDFYGAKFGEAYLEVIGGNYKWEKNLAQYGVDTILLSVGSSLASTLKESRRWRTVYDDGVAIVFRPAQSAKTGGLPPKTGGLPPVPAFGTGWLSPVFTPAVENRKPGDSLHSVLRATVNADCRLSPVFDFHPHGCGSASCGGCPPVFTTAQSPVLAALRPAPTSSSVAVSSGNNRDRMVTLIPETGE